MKPTLNLPGVLFALALVTFSFLWAQEPAIAPDAAPPPPPSAPPTNSTPPPLPKLSLPNLSMKTLPESEYSRLTQDNRDLLDLLKKQQAVLEDIQNQYRTQSHHVINLEQHLEEALLENARLKVELAEFQAKGGVPAVAPTPPVKPPSGVDTNAMALEPLPPQPDKLTSHLPDAPTTPEGVFGWRRLMKLSGKDSQSTDFFHISGKTWRVVWYNEDFPGARYVNTSALFISAFPKNDTIPQKACSKVGNGKGESLLKGPGNYMLKIESSGGNWELAVEELGK